jgi:hypothetical protein
MKVRIGSAGWETFTGRLGGNAIFEDGVCEDISPRDVQRIATSIILLDFETNEQIGPAVIHASMKFDSAPVIEPLIEKTEVDAKEEEERERLAKEAEERAVQEAKDLEAAREKAAAEAAQTVYTRQELEAVGANDGIEGLREIATPLGVKGRSIAELVDSILQAQAKIAAA